MPTDWPSLHGSHFATTRALVTGGAGFIGSHLCEALLGLGARVVILDDLSGSDRSNIDALEANAGGRLQFKEGSILDSQLVQRCAAGCDVVFHHAALASVPRSVAEPRLFHDVNCTGTLNVLEGARHSGVRRVVFAASSSAYGDSEELPKVETMAPLPKSPYAANKLAGEALMRAYAGSFGLDTASLRYFNIFGPRQNANSAYAAVIAAFAKALLADTAPVIFGDGQQSRDFTFVENAVHANLLAARKKDPIEGEVFNIACGQRVSVNDLASLMAEMLDRPHLEARHEPARAGDVLHSLADLSRARAVLGYEPIVPFRQGLESTVHWYRGALDKQR